MLGYARFVRPQPKRNQTPSEIPIAIGFWLSFGYDLVMPILRFSEKPVSGASFF
jgi:hypothetical protein